MNEPFAADGTGPPSGSRGNGLSAASWVPLGDCDPRVADELLGALAAVMIGAYAEPSPGERGGYLEIKLPHRPVDRLYVDGSRRREAEQLLRSQLVPVDGGGEHLPGSLDVAFDEIVAGFTAPVVADRPDWPAAEELAPGSELPPLPVEGPPVARYRPASHEPGLLDPGGLLHESLLGDGRRPRGVDPFEGDDSHYEPPEPPPLAPAHPVTRAAWLAILAGFCCLVAPALGLFSDARMAEILGALLVVGGVVTLVARLRDEPVGNDGDDGAIV